ncbi:hypothetical protein FIBSPDRAFT_854168 [Athelia psychrophila]|uniref:Cytochrome P450 n=1 Tax=Athelia psychrophila TaxID=1759441 RepID=A0A166QKD0_9AGAM|nr:hypothetical protein FIBSPDRAFT_854168 [Fibularhizoctonia sp. CBS 109695]
MRARYSASEIMPDRDIISKVMAHMVAGSDTTIISLSYFLRDEPASGHRLRLHGVVPSLLERVVPSPTSKTVSPASLSTQWAMHSRPAPSSPPGLAS